MRLDRWMAMLRLRGRSVFLRQRVDRELDEELAYHVDRLVEQHLANGATPAEARRAAFAAMYL